MKLAYTMSDIAGDVDRLLYELSRDLGARGLRLAGTVQVNRDRAVGPCDMDVHVLPDGPKICISQDLGGGAKGCRLDPGALEQAVGLVAAQLDRVPDLLIVNKFGKHEADGRGFRPLIAEAIALDIPVLVGLNRLNRDAFERFAGDGAEYLDPDVATLSRWVSASIAEPMVV